MRTHPSDATYAVQVNRSTYDTQESSVRFSLGGSLGPLRVYVALESTNGSGQATYNFVDTRQP